MHIIWVKPETLTPQIGCPQWGPVQPSLHRHSPLMHLPPFKHVFAQRDTSWCQGSKFGQLRSDPNFTASHQTHFLSWRLFFAWIFNFEPCLVKFVFVTTFLHFSVWAVTHVGRGANSVATLVGMAQRHIAHITAFSRLVKLIFHIEF